MENNYLFAVPVKRPRLAVADTAAFNKHSPSMEARTQMRRWLCNELIHEFCGAIPAVKTSNRILLTSCNIYTYLEPSYRKKLICAPAFALISNTKWWERIVIEINQEVAQSIKSIAMQNNQKNNFNVSVEAVKGNCYECWTNPLEITQIHYFLRLIAPLLHPIKLDIAYRHPLKVPVAELVHLLNVQSSCIDSVKLGVGQFNSAPIYGALNKYNKLHIEGPLSHVNVPKIVQWLTSNTNGQPKKCLFDGSWYWIDALTRLIDAIKMDFVRATNKRRFVVPLLARNELVEFTLCNETSGEMLELRRCTNVNGENFSYMLRRFPIGELLDHNNANWCTAEVDKRFVSKIILR